MTDWHPPGYRVFGRPRAFDVECPACGAVQVIGYGRGRQGKYKPGEARSYWDPYTSRWTCPQCQRIWIVGLALWRPITGPGRRVKPADAVPDLQQAAELRQQTGSWVQDREVGGRTAHVNVAPPCSCPLWEEGSLKGYRKRLEPGCLRHGTGGTEPDGGE
jgi:hypothetical protein